MKSAIFFAGLALAAPAVQKRDVATDLVIVTEWTTTTEYVSQPTPNAFFEQQPASVAPAPVAASPSPAAVSVAPAAPAVAAYTPPAVTTTPAAAPAYTPPAYTPPAAQPAAQVAAAAPAAAAAAAPASGGGPSGTGQATFYDVSVGLGSCGHQSSNNENVVALSHSIMTTGGNPNANPLCGKTITITYNGKTSTGTVVDTCEGCDANSIDLSPGFFSSAIGSQSLGRVSGVSWSVS